MNPHDDERGLAAIGGLASELPRELTPPPDLERRIVRELDRRHLLSASGGMLRRRLAWAASVVLLFAIGLATGRLTAGSPPAAPSGPRFLLLLYEPHPLDPAASEAERVAEYSAWAGGLARAGRLVEAEKLADGGHNLGLEVAAGAGDGPTGFYLFTARDEAEALSIAHDCPHLRHGGEATLRRIDPT